MFDRGISAIASRAALIIAVMACGTQALVLFYDHATIGAFANDFVVHWSTANRPLSLAYEQRFHYPFPYLPTMLLWIGPLSLVPAAPAYLGWVMVSAVTFTWATRRYLTMGQNLLALISYPVTFCLVTGQVSVFLAAVMLWSFGTSRKLWAGVALGAVASVKPQLVLLAPLLMLLRRDFRMFVAAGTSFLGIVLLSLLTFGIQPWIDWLASLDHFRTWLNMADMLRHSASPAGQAERAGYPPLPFLALGLTFGSWLVYRCRDLGPVEITAAVATASIFASPYAMTYDLAVIVPFLAVTVFSNRLLSAVALTALFHPLAIFATAYELLRKAKQEVRERTMTSGSERSRPGGEFCEEPATSPATG